MNHSIENGRYIKGFFSPERENITLCKDTIESNEEVMITYEYTKLAYYDSCTWINTYVRLSKRKSIEFTRKYPIIVQMWIVVHNREYRAAYYGDCYNASSSISFIRKSCIIQHGKECTKVKEIEL